MSCIVAIIKDGKGYMGADGQGTYYGVKMPLIGPKIFEKKVGTGVLLIGGVGRLRVLQIVKHEFDPPTPLEGQDIEGYMQTTFIPALKTTLENKGAVCKAPQDGDHIAGSSELLVVIKGRIFEISGDYALTEIARDYACLGSGMFHADGCLYATADLPPKERVTKALEAAALFNEGVGPPFAYLETE